MYAFHFSDGEDFAPQDSTQELRKLIDKGINMFGYGEIHVDELYRSYTNLLPTFKESFSLTEEQIPADEAPLNVCSGAGNFPFFGVVIEDKKQIWPALKEFLKKNRWS